MWYNFDLWSFLKLIKIFATEERERGVTVTEERVVFEFVGCSCVGVCGVGRGFVFRVIPSVILVL
jgi:hypothetical protein